MTRNLPRAVVLLAALLLPAALHAADDSAVEPKPAPAPSTRVVFLNVQLEKASGEAVNGLKLTLAADRTDLAARPSAEKPAPPPPKKPTLKMPDQPMIAERTPLRLVFTNVSDKPITLDACALALQRVSLIVVGPERNTVSIARREVVPTPQSPIPADYSRIEPGQTWTAPQAILFPGEFNTALSYGLHKPGDYKLQAIYDRPAFQAAAGTWQGLVVSNTVTIRLAPPTSSEKLAPPAE